MKLTRKSDGLNIPVLRTGTEPTRRPYAGRSWDEIEILVDGKLTKAYVDTTRGRWIHLQLHGTWYKVQALPWGDALRHHAEFTTTAPPRIDGVKRQITKTLLEKLAAFEDPNELRPMAPLKAGAYTLGCRAGQRDLRGIAQLIREAGAKGLVDGPTVDTAEILEKLEDWKCPRDPKTMPEGLKDAYALGYKSAQADLARLGLKLMYRIAEQRKIDLARGTRT